MAQAATIRIPSQYLLRHPHAHLSIPESRASIESFVKEIEVRPGKAVVRYTIPMPEDSPIGGADAAEVALTGRVRSTVQFGGPKWTIDRTIFELWLGTL